MKRIALVTARSARELDEDLPPLQGALEALGARGEPVVWDDPAVDWGAYPLAVVRSTWDYVARRDEFLSWADRASRATRLLNPPAILRWNTHKTYLREMARAGVPVVPTHFVEPGDRCEIPFEGEIVVKPAVGAGSVDTERYARRDLPEVASHVRRLQSAGRTVMVQPYLKRLDEAGETAMVFFEGEYSHSIRKGPILGASYQMVGGLFAKEDIRRREATAEEQRLAERVLSCVPGGPKKLLYARVDAAPGPDGKPVLLEFEATEPSVFLAFADGAAERFARAILRLA